MSKETHFNYERSEKNRRGEWEVVGKARLTPEEAETLNLDIKRTGIKFDLVKEKAKRNKK